jgi:hypothetical protein
MATSRTAAWVREQKAIIKSEDKKTPKVLIIGVGEKHLTAEMETFVCIWLVVYVNQYDCPERMQVDEWNLNARGCYIALVCIWVRYRNIVIPQS